LVTDKKKVESSPEDVMPRTYYERDEDWLITCPECHGEGTIGTGGSRKKCAKCGGAGRIKR